MEIARIRDCTDAEIIKRRGGSPITERENYRYLGIRLAVGLNPIRVSMKDYWNKKNDEESMFQCRKFGEPTNISFCQFDRLDSAFRLDGYVMNDVNDVSMT